jgi:hypothetical protein
MTPAHLHAQLQRCEIDGDLALDCRRVLKDERQALGLALQSGDGARIKAAHEETLRVCVLWGVEVRS